MPQPVLIGSTYYLRVIVPRELRNRAAGTVVALPIGDRLSRLTLNTRAKVSLRTKDWPEAKRRYSQALAALEDHWETLRRGPGSLTHKQAVALAGEVVGVFVEAFDEDPKTPEMWENIEAVDLAARKGRSNPLAVPTEESKARDVERRFGALTDATLERRGLVVDPVSRVRLLQRVAVAMEDVARVNGARARGDYSETDVVDKYPAYVPKTEASREQAREATDKTFADVIDAEVARRAAGRDAKPMSSSAERKYRRAADEFASHRKSKNVGTVTVRQADEWMRTMLEGGKLSNTPDLPPGSSLVVM
ncbi:DUF6538 domain-containing protein [Pseudoponticoccus marisrubri]|uniref:DUF6538 domain-containing protein n=1 Tax=Pseudoponticoccus marisrubri TaxID=1685382 RepID=A0A0W7WP86_9RHOB|nr:DUF6538 domain-containing protein [Pseudoponticoccus marisrubri]KUF12324.1 hypothetical protein AVJ23_00905 [Pseudoponticoccus marisrubri]